MTKTLNYIINHTEVLYTYNAPFKRLSSVGDELATTTFKYNAFGDVTRQYTKRYGQSTFLNDRSISYDELGRAWKTRVHAAAGNDSSPTDQDEVDPTQLTEYNTAGWAIAEIRKAGNGDLDSVEDSDALTKYEHDNLGRVAKVLRAKERGPGSNDDKDSETQFVYDRKGNMLTQGTRIGDTSSD